MKVKHILIGLPEGFSEKDCTGLAIIRLDFGDNGEEIEIVNMGSLSGNVKLDSVMKKLLDSPLKLSGNPIKLNS